MKNDKCVLQITESMLREANMSDAVGLTITSLHKAVVITENDVMECLPEELLDIFEDCGVSEDTVRNVLSQDNGKDDTK